MLSFEACCVIRYKDTNLKAIHNSLAHNLHWQVAVSSDTKIQIWKQFTTHFVGTLRALQLCHPIQRYKFESNSQRAVYCINAGCRCVIRYKDTNLKAIHNAPACTSCSWGAVSSDTKIQIWKQFTTTSGSETFWNQLCHPIQRYKFESNSQRISRAWSLKNGCVIRYKDTNLKAIHNMITLNKLTKELCHPIQRYKFESNSQHNRIMT